MSAGDPAQAPPALWRVSFVARPGAEPDVGDSEEPPGGAYVNVYVVNPSGEQAAQVARDGVEEAGWWIEECDDPVRLDLARLADEEVDLVEQARADGAVWVFHTWPRGALDDPGPVPG